MKKIILLVSIAFSLLSCKKDGYEVTGTIKGLENGTKIYIEVLDEAGMPVTIDTTTFENNKFTFDGKLKNGTELAMIKYAENKYLPFIIENGTIKMDAIKDSIQPKIGGTKNNDLFQSFNDLNKEVMKKATEFQKVNNQKYMTALQSQDMATIQSLQNEMKKFSDELNKNSKDFVAKNPDAYISLLLLDNFLTNAIVSKEDVKKSFDKLDKTLLETKLGIKIKKKLDEKSPEMNIPPMEQPNNKTTNIK